MDSDSEHKDSPPHVRTNRRIEVNLVSRKESMQLCKTKFLHHEYELNKSIHYINHSAELNLNKKLQALYIESNYYLKSLNRDQEKFFKKFKFLDELKRKIVFAEYIQQLNYLKENLKSSKNLKFKTDTEMIQSELFKNLKLHIKTDLLQRFKLKKQVDLRRFSDSNDQVVGSFPHLNRLQSIDRTDLYSLIKQKNLNKIEESANMTKLLTNKRLSVVMCTRQKSNRDFKAYKLNQDGNIVETELPKPKTFEFYFDQMHKNKLETSLKKEQQKNEKCKKQIKDFITSLK